jgi:hypothetical protein
MTSTGFRTLAHAMAALDEFPISGAMQITPDHPGVDFDALGRMRKLLPAVWRDEVPIEDIQVTPQGGICLVWNRNGWEMQLICDPYSLDAFRVDSPFGVNEWTRPSTESTIIDAKATLQVMAQEKGAGAAPPPA